MKKSILKVINQLIGTIIGTAITGFGIAVFLTPNKIVLGGASGISTLLYHTFNIPQGLSFAAINAFLLLLCIRVLGKQFTVNTIIGAGILSAFIQLFSYIPPLTDNIILASLFGGLLYGLGIGIAFSVNSSTGGMDILGRFIQHYFPHIQVGKILQLINGLIIAASYIVFKNVELILFSVLAMFIATFTIDWFISKLNISVIAFVISEKGEEISKFLVSSSPRGVTLMKVIGAYKFEEKKMLFCALKKAEVAEFQSKILGIDENAFIVYSQSTEIMGNGFHIYH